MGESCRVMVVVGGDETDVGVGGEVKVADCLGVVGVETTDAGVPGVERIDLGVAGEEGAEESYAGEANEDEEHLCEYGEEGEPGAGDLGETGVGDLGETGVGDLGEAGSGVPGVGVTDLGESGVGDLEMGESGRAESDIQRPLTPLCLRSSSLSPFVILSCSSSIKNKTELIQYPVSSTTFRKATRIFG